MWPSKVFIPLPDQGDKQNTGDTCARRKDEKEHFFSLLYFALDYVVSEIGSRDNLLSYKIHMGEISQGVQSMNLMSYFLYFRAPI